MKQLMKNQEQNVLATVIFHPTDKTGITGNILFKVMKIGVEERTIGHDKNVSVGMFFDIIKRLQKKGFVEQ